MHFHFDEDHHHVENVQHDEACHNTIHFHEVELAAQCFICDFNFSPVQSLEVDQHEELAKLYKATLLIYDTPLISSISAQHPPVRGPPQLFYI